MDVESKNNIAQIVNNLMSALMMPVNCNCLKDGYMEAVSSVLSFYFLMTRSSPRSITENFYQIISQSSSQCLISELNMFLVAKLSPQCVNVTPSHEQTVLHSNWILEGLAFFWSHPLSVHLLSGRKQNLLDSNLMGLFDYQ